MEEIVIRRAGEADVAAIHRLEREWVAEGISHGFAPDDEEQIRRGLGPYLLVAESAGRVIGFVAGAVHASEGLAVAPAGTAYLEVENLYVGADFRRRGVGGRLVEQVLEAARREGVRKALVYSATKDVRRILDFYEGHGFRPWYVRMFRDL